MVDVKNDYWFKLPRIEVDQLRQLTGLKKVSFVSGEAHTTWRSIRTKRCNPRD